LQKKTIYIGYDELIVGERGPKPKAIPISVPGIIQMGSGFIFDIKHYSINDGPGIRITVFFKGCNLNCAWCHNPESVAPKAQKLYSENRCIRCKVCVDNCSEHACILTENGIVTNINLYKLCGRCVQVCPTTASEFSGRYETSGNISKIISIFESCGLESTIGG
jgi:pyruvate formate lyase activating enzyme